MPFRNGAETSPWWLARKRGPRPSGVSSGKGRPNRMKVEKAMDARETGAVSSTYVGYFGSLVVI